MTNRPVSLTDKYNVEQADVFLTGTQALVRLALMQAALDRQAGLNTAGYVSGYRGSPLGAIVSSSVMLQAFSKPPISYLNPA